LLARLQPTQVQGLYRQFAARGLAQRTIRTIHAIVCKALRAAYRQGLTARNVAELLTPPSVPRRIAQPLTSAQARQLLDASRGSTASVP
jgi:site-specific recombinase XerC